MRTDKEKIMVQHCSVSVATEPAVSPRRRAARPRRTALALAGLTLAGLCGTGRPALANVADQPGQAVGLTIQAMLYACSLTSIVGNSVNIATKHPQRGWLYSGFICGFTNTVVSPVMLIFFNNRRASLRRHRRRDPWRCGGYKPCAGGLQRGPVAPGPAGRQRAAEGVAAAAGWA